MVGRGQNQRKIVDPFESPDGARQDDDATERFPEALRLEHDDIARRVLDEVIDVAPEDPPIPFDPLAPPPHDEQVHRLLADCVQDDLVHLVSDLDDGARVDAEMLANPRESLETANPVVDIPEADGLRREVARNLDDMQEAQLGVTGFRDPRP